MLVTRCPWCHDDVDPVKDPWVVCASCLARHHRACWSDARRCSTCAGTEVLGRSGLGAPLGFYALGLAVGAAAAAGYFWEHDIWPIGAAIALTPFVLVLASSFRRRLGRLLLALLRPFGRVAGRTRHAVLGVRETAAGRMAMEVFSTDEGVRARRERRRHEGEIG